MNAVIDWLKSSQLDRCLVFLFVLICAIDEMKLNVMLLIVATME